MDMIRVLVVEQHPAVRQALVTRLNAVPGLEAAAAAPSLPEALECLSAYRPDVVLLELKGDRGLLRWPLLRQIATAQNGAEDSDDNQPGVIVLTSYADDVQRDLALQAGARRYLLKNIDSAHLIAEIQAVAAELGKPVAGY